MSEAYYFDKIYTVGSFRNVPVRLHSSFFLLLFIELVSSLRLIGTSGAYFPFVILLYGPILLITVLFHELGHILMAKKLGGVVEEVVLWPLGGYVICDLTPTTSIVGDLKVAIAGPLMHFPQMLVWFLLYLNFSNGNLYFFRPEIYLDLISESFVEFLKTLFCMAFYLNLLLFSFNFFIPAYPLDGGRCMAATLVMLGMSLRKTALIVSITGMLVSVLLFILGLVSFFVERNPRGLFTALVSGYMAGCAKDLYDMMLAGKEKDHPLFNRPCYDERETSVEQVVNEANDDDDDDDGTEMTGGNLA